MIVVDDASTDRTKEIASSFGVKIFSLETRQNANFCRNIGAENAEGDILLFIDSDVFSKKNTIEMTHKAFEKNNVDAIVGVYAVSNEYPNLTSKYKNLWIRFSYMISEPAIDWIFGAVSAIKKDVFLKADGFKKGMQAKRGTDDLELGKRLSKMNYKILLEASVEVVHLKTFSLWSLLQNDFRRSKWFVSLAGNLGQLGSSTTKGFVNIYPNFVFSTVLSVPLVMLLIFTLVYSWNFVPVIFLLLLYYFLNRKFINYFAANYGIAQSILALGLMLLDNLICALGSFAGILSIIFNRNEKK